MNEEYKESWLSKGESSFTITPYQALSQRFSSNIACIHTAHILLNDCLLFLHSQWEYDYMESANINDIIYLMDEFIIPRLKEFEPVVDKLFLIYEKNLPKHIEYFNTKFIELSILIAMIDRCMRTIQTWGDNLVNGIVGAKEEKIDRSKVPMELVSAVALLGKINENLEYIGQLLRQKAQYLGHHDRELKDPEGYPRHELPEIFRHSEPEKFLSPD